MLISWLLCETHAQVLQHTGREGVVPLFCARAAISKLWAQTFPLTVIVQSAQLLNY